MSPQFVKANNDDSSEALSMRKKLVAERCDRVTNRISERITRWDNNEPEKHRLYNNIVPRVQKMITNLKAKGYDTAELQEALNNLNDAILKRHADAKVLVSLLKDTKEFACGESEGAFKDALKKAQDQWKIFHADTLEIRNIWQNQVRPAIRKLKEQKRNITPSPKPTEVEDEL